MNSSGTPDYSGTIIQPATTWAGGTLASPGVLYVNGSTGTIHKPGVSNLWVDGTNLPSGAHGITVFGGAFHGTIVGVGVFNVPQDGMRFEPNTGGGRADGWTVRDSVVQTFGGHGLFQHGQDSQFINVHIQAAPSSTTSGPCWYVDNGNNCRWIGCRADQSGDSGWTLDSNPGGSPDSPGSSITLVGCGTEGNANYGLHLINTSGTGGQIRTPVVAVGCSFDFDGRSNPTGGGAGVRVEGYNTLQLIGCDVTIGTAAPVHPQYALVTALAGTPTPTTPPTLIRAVGGMWNCNAATLVNDTAGMGTSGGLHIDVYGVTGGAWTSGSTIAPFNNGIVTTPAAVTTPAVPATNGTVTNATGIDVAVYISGGVVSKITVGGTQVLSASPATVYLPAGATIGLTWSTKPSWVWQGI
jgi:hypothetical protein